MRHSFSRPSDDDELYELVNCGLALYNAGYSFEAHEFWEYAWAGERGRTRLTLQALIQVAAALYKHDLGVPAGTCKLLAKAEDKIGEVRSGCASWMGIDLAYLENQVTRSLKQADRIYNGHDIDLSRPILPSHVNPDRIIYLHGFASSPGSKKASIIVTALRTLGYDVVIPDLNQDDFSALSISRSLAQVKALLCDRNLVIGSSLGGYTASLLAAHDDRVKGLILMAPAFDFARNMAERHGEVAIADWSFTGSVDVDHYGTGQSEPLNYGFYEDAQIHEAYPPLRVPTYVLHGRQDETVDVNRSIEAVKRFANHVELDLVDDDHSLVASANRALDAASRFASQLQLRPAAAPTDPKYALGILKQDPRFGD
jgi:uncharacterized protein